MAMANMNLIGVFVTKLWAVQALACGGGGGGGDGGDGGATKNIISPKFSKFRGYNYNSEQKRKQEKFKKKQEKQTRFVMTRVI